MMLSREESLIIEDQMAYGLDKLRKKQRQNQKHFPRYLMNETFLVSKKSSESNFRIYLSLYSFTDNESLVNLKELSSFLAKIDFSTE